MMSLIQHVNQYICLSFTNTLIFNSFNSTTLLLIFCHITHFVYKSKLNGSSERSFLLYCNIHPSITDYLKRKKKKMQDGIWLAQKEMKADERELAGWGLSRLNDWKDLAYVTGEKLVIFTKGRSSYDILITRSKHFLKMKHMYE